MLDVPADNAKLWRYMDLSKFINLLDTSTLYLTRAALFQDPFEGSYPRANAVEPHGDPSSRLAPLRKRLRDFYYVNCWHMNEYESAAMWDLYAAKGAGIAIRTSFKALKESIIEQAVDPIYITKVKYIDYDTQEFAGPRADSDGFSAFMYKRKSFEHEREVRVLTTNRLYLPSPGNVEIVPGLRLNMNLERLIESVSVSPTASALFTNSVRAVVRKFAWSGLSVERSDLERPPLY